jgi:hypothetical protein
MQILLTLSQHFGDASLPFQLRLGQSMNFFQVVTHRLLAPADMWLNVWTKTTCNCIGVESQVVDRWCLARNYEFLNDSSTLYWLDCIIFSAAPNLLFCYFVLMMSSEVGRDCAWNNSIPATKAGQDGVRLIEIKEIHKKLCFLLQSSYKNNKANTQKVKTIQDASRH